MAGKTKWIPLNTTDREIASRNLKAEITKFKNTDSKKSTTTLEELLDLYEQSIQGLAEHTQKTRKSILKAFKTNVDQWIRPAGGHFTMLNGMKQHKN